MGETTAENSRATSVSRARWLKDIVKAKDKKAASVAAWKLLFYEHPRPDPARFTQPQLETMRCFFPSTEVVRQRDAPRPSWAKMLLHVASKQVKVQ